jgi:hypothetical protein
MTFIKLKTKRIYSPNFFVILTFCVLSLCTLAFSSCNKNKSTPSSNSSASSNTSTVSPAPTPSLTSGLFFYVFHIQEYQQFNILDYSLNTTNDFYEPAIVYGSLPLIPTDAGTATVNGTVMNKLIHSPTSASYATADTYTDFPLAYAISGNGTVPAMSFTDTGSSMPRFSNYLQFPNSISKSAGITFSLQNLVNTDLATL